MLDEVEQRIVDDIAEFGWHLLSIHATADAPPFCYTIGLMHTLDHPEVILFGLDGNVAGKILNEIGEQIRSGRPFDQPGLYEGVLAHFACKMRPVSPRFHTDYLGYAMWHRRHVGQHGTLTAMQCLWPDKAGLFPDEPGFNSEIAHLQPLL